MAFGLSDLTDGVRHSRSHFLKHLKGLQPEQWTWKPYPECKSIYETVSHLVVDDRAALQALQTGGEPDYDSFKVTAVDADAALAELAGSHAELLSYIESTFANAPLDTRVSAWGAMVKLGNAVSHLSSEDYYHAGQVSFVRMATDPTWDYYADIYGGE